ncbi:MAG: CPBP family intramembrane glutamic endopeptidase [Spirochaetaceae bacterium]
MRQSGGMEVELFLSPQFHFYYLLRAVPQLLLLLYIVSLRGGTSGRRYGVILPRPGELGYSFLTFLGVLALAMAAGAAAYSLGADPPFFSPPPGGGTPAGETSAGLGSAGYLLSPSSPAAYICILITCLVIGYHEELFFRAYLLSEFVEVEEDGSFFRSRTTATVGAGALLFAAGHLYQGTAGFLGTLLIGLFLSYRFLRRRSLHEVAIAHGMYNFTAVLFLLHYS